MRAFSHVAFYSVGLIVQSVLQYHLPSTGQQDVVRVRICFYSHSARVYCIAQQRARLSQPRKWLGVCVCVCVCVHATVAMRAMWFSRASRSLRAVGVRVGNISWL